LDLTAKHAKGAKKEMSGMVKNHQATVISVYPWRSSRASR
jgi:hypothetical protein